MGFFLPHRTRRVFSIFKFSNFSRFPTSLKHRREKKGRKKKIKPRKKKKRRTLLSIVVVVGSSTLGSFSVTTFDFSLVFDLLRNRSPLPQKKTNVAKKKGRSRRRAEGREPDCWAAGGSLIGKLKQIKRKFRSKKANRKVD